MQVGNMQKEKDVFSQVATAIIKIQRPPNHAEYQPAPTSTEPQLSTLEA